MDKEFDLGIILCKLVKPANCEHRSVISCTNLPYKNLDEQIYYCDDPTNFSKCIYRKECAIIKREDFISDKDFLESLKPKVKK